MRVFPGLYCLNMKRMRPFPQSPLPPVEKVLQTSQPVDLTTCPVYLELSCLWTGLGWSLQSCRDMGSRGLIVLPEVILEQSQRTRCQNFELNVGGFWICCIKNLLCLLQLIWNSGVSIQLHGRRTTVGEDLPEHHKWFKLCPICKSGWTGWRAFLPTLLPSSPSTSLDTSLAVIKMSQELPVDGPVACRSSVAAAQGCRS